jgi:hypothetical protein
LGFTCNFHDYFYYKIAILTSASDLTALTVAFIVLVGASRCWGEGA